MVVVFLRIVDMIFGFQSQIEPSVISVLMEARGLSIDPTIHYSCNWEQTSPE